MCMVWFKVIKYIVIDKDYLFLWTCSWQDTKKWPHSFFCGTPKFNTSHCSKNFTFNFVLWILRTRSLTCYFKLSLIFFWKWKSEWDYLLSIEQSIWYVSHRLCSVQIIVCNYDSNHIFHWFDVKKKCCYRCKVHVNCEIRYCLRILLKISVECGNCVCKSRHNHVLIKNSLP